MAPLTTAAQIDPQTPEASIETPVLDWYQQEPSTALTMLASTREGLSDNDAAERFATDGPNELIDRGTKHPFLIFWEQLTTVMVLILIAAAGLSLVLGKFLEAGAILAIVVLFALLGFFQEYRAEKAIAALKKLAVPNVRVRRDGKVREVSARDLVPGDIVLLEAGNVVPADVRIIESANLRIQEAALTGESEPVEKQIGAITGQDIALGDRRNMGYMGTQVTYGRGVAAVVATGMQTELGKIATLIQGVKTEMTPLQQRLDRVGKQLAGGGTVIALIMLVMGIVVGERWQDMLLTAISVAVAVIPEGLPAVVTFTLALGAQRMLRRNALIRKLPAVETLGSVTIICSDKTGTLTKNSMTVTVVDVAGQHLELTEGTTLANAEQSVKLLLAGGALCNDAQLQTTTDAEPRMIGDPTEGALLVAATQGGMHKETLEAVLPRVAELPFDSDRKRMTTIHRVPIVAGRRPEGESGSVLEELALVAGEAPLIGFTKGAVDGLIGLSTHVWEQGRAVPMTAVLQARIASANDGMARNGMRVLGVAFRPFTSADGLNTETAECELVFIGLLGIIDPPRSEVKAAVATCLTAGIRPVMITGDHPLTASYIARDLGIARDERVITGTQLGEMNDAELSEAVKQTSVFARVSPEHKLRIVGALQAQGHVVAMTGDGVNDAPALKKADIGVAMGITGTDVSKEASDMVLRDDNFATIVAAVEEGRVIYDNVRRFVKFAVAGNIGKVLVMLVWPILFFVTGLPLVAAVALLPLQLLWLNLMTDGLLGLSMGVEPAERNVMQRKPHAPTSGIFTGMGAQTVWVGVALGALALAVGFAYYTAGQAQWQTMMFTTLAFGQMFQALATRSNRESLFTIGVFTNRVMWGVIALVVVLQMVALYTPLALFLGLQALSLVDVLVCVVLGIILFVAVEIEKFFLRSRSVTPTAPVPPQA